jgi:hypothetical protein
MTCSSVAMALRLTLAVVAMPSSPVQATTYYVDDDGCPGPGTGTPADLIELARLLGRAGLSALPGTRDGAAVSVPWQFCLGGGQRLVVVVYPPRQSADGRCYHASRLVNQCTDTAFSRNPNYHLVTDTADTLDYERMAQVVTGVYAAMTTP